MSILRNIFAGREERYPFGFLKMKKMRETAMSILNEHVKIAGITSPDLLVEELSGGQAQAVAIARAVHFQRDILLLDEPTSALSVRETNKVLAIMRDIAEGGRSCVFVTHNLYHAYQVCDRFVVVSHGTVVKSVRKEETSLDELTALIMTH
jgi:simple sugar transport system ATP-binding protein